MKISYKILMHVIYFQIKNHMILYLIFHTSEYFSVKYLTIKIYMTMYKILMLLLLPVLAVFSVRAQETEDEGEPGNVFPIVNYTYYADRDLTPSENGQVLYCPKKTSASSSYPKGLPMVFVS